MKLCEEGEHMVERLFWSKKPNRKSACLSCSRKYHTPIGNYKLSTKSVSSDIKPVEKRTPINKKSDKQKKIDALYKVLNVAYLAKNKTCMAQFEGICQGRATELHHTYFGSNKRKHYLNEPTFKALCVACHWHLHNKMNSDELVKLGLRILD